MISRISQLNHATHMSNLVYSTQLFALRSESVTETYFLLKIPKKSVKMGIFFDLKTEGLVALESEEVILPFVLNE